MDSRPVHHSDSGDTSGSNAADSSIQPAQFVRLQVQSPKSAAETPDLQPGAHALHTPLGDDVGFTITASLVDSADADFQKYQGKRHVKILNKAGDTLNVIQTDVTVVQSYASPLQTVMDSDPAKAIRQTINALVDGIPALLKLLDDVAQIHPFIKVAVGAFRVAVELDLKRRDNDKKVPLLFVEMRDMMAVLSQLREINRDQRAGDGKRTIQDRMENIIIKTRDDITNCASVCSAYSKKRTFTKVLQSSSWDDKFKGFVAVFTTRRGEFEFELSMYVGRAVNTANDRLVTIDEKIDRLTQLFEACVTPEERHLLELVKANGGPEAVIGDDATLRKLYEDKGLAPLLARSADRRTGPIDPEKEFKDLREDLKIDTETAIRKNFQQFERMFAIQQRELEEEMRRSMHREGDRVILSVTAGPHDRILDPDIHEIWKEMRWRGNVKARHFVLALRDYFREQLDEIKGQKGSATPTIATRRISKEDEWTLEYISVTRLQPIIEAFDDDASGFITVAEANTFTKARPDDWSLLHWLAYWAVGHQMVMSEYAKKIDILLAKMFSLKALVLPANRNSIDQYLDVVCTIVAALTGAFRRSSMDESLMARFEGYTKSEEGRLRRNLEDARYDFDARDTLDIVRGPGTIEKHILPLLYLLLARHFEIMRLARTRLLNVDEMHDACNTITRVFQPLDERCDDLTDLFKQQKLDPDQQFKIFGYEIFRFWHDFDEFTSPKRLKETKFVEVEYDDAVEAQDVDPAAILNHPVHSPEELFANLTYAETEADAQADPHVRAILGHWSGFGYTDKHFPMTEMDCIDFHASPSDAKRFQASGFATSGSGWDITGEYTVDGESGKVTYAFTRIYKSRYASETFRGNLSSNGTTLLCNWKCALGDVNFLYKRLSADAMKFWPSPAELDANKSRALWTFACNAVRYDVARRMHSWTWLQQRWDNGKEYLKIRHKQAMGPLTADEERTLSKCYRGNTPEEASLYQIFLDLRIRSVPDHLGISCDACGSHIRGGRVMCLSCGIKDTVDLCDKPECCAKAVGTDVREDLVAPHLPSHDMFKVRTALHSIREFGPAHRAAMEALKFARNILEDTGEHDPASAPPDAQAATETQPEPRKLPSCAKCGDQVSQPCWYCIDCRVSTAESGGGIFICAACDIKHRGFTAGTHKATHALVKVQVQDSADRAASERAMIDARMNTLEGSLKEMQYKFDQSFVSVDEKVEFVKTRLGVKMDERLGQLEGRMRSMDSRLQRMEDLLLLVGQCLGVTSGAGATRASTN